MGKKITVTATGDSLITRRMPDYQDAPFTRMLDHIHGCDVAFTNMEMVLSNYQGSPVVESGGGNLSAEPGVAEDLMEMGFNLTAFANNHTLNYGEYGCMKTVEVLEELGFACAGAGKNLAEARKPVYLDTDAGRIGLVGCASSFATGQRAGAQAPGIPGRPGLNPQRFDTLYVVDQEHIDAIQTIADRTGVEKMRQFREWIGFQQPPKREGEFHFTDRSFIVGDEFGIRTEAHQKDLEGNMASIRQAAATSDLTLVSMHAHEQGKERWIPADFIEEFAHAAIDNGADMFIGHGPHLLRGLEIYKGKPIFYSVANFIFQFHLMQHFPVDDYETVNVDPSKSVSELFNQIFKGDKQGFPADRLYWETVLPIVEFEDRKLKSIELHPLTLGYRQPPTERGIPRLAEGELATEILDWMKELSEAYGTTIEIEDGVGMVRMGT
jgi:poly-gamma-glutamate capsule biosynthesis protein CapA/YwtB (metallophosphatase superfamily)